MHFCSFFRLALPPKSDTREELTALKALDKLLRTYDRRSTPTNDLGKNTLLITQVNSSISSPRKIVEAFIFPSLFFRMINIGMHNDVKGQKLKNCN